MAVESTVELSTGRCTFCDKEGSVTVTLDQALRIMSQRGQAYVEGAPRHIQDIVPEMPEGDREQIISGTHSACFDAIFGDEEEE